MDSSPVLHQPADLAAWQLAGQFVVRSTGFAFDLLERLRQPRTAALLGAIQQSEQQSEQLQQNFAEEIFPRLCAQESARGGEREAFRLWYTLARKIRLGQGIEPSLLAQLPQAEPAGWLRAWNEAVEAGARLRQEGTACFADEFAGCRASLHEIVSMPRFQEALWLSNPGVYETGWQYYQRHWQPPARPSKMKHMERRFYTYLQRFCAKNDTTSFFGPLNYGSCGPQAESTLLRTGEPIQARHVFLAYRAVEALAESIAQDSATHPYLIAHRSFLRPWQAGRQGELADALYGHCDGQLRLAEIAAVLQRPVEEIIAASLTLAEQGWLKLAPALPPASLFPLERLIAELQAWPPGPARQRWLGILEQFADGCTRFASAPLQERQVILARVEELFTRVTDSPARRGQGQMFQDRSLLYEECLGNIAAFQLSVTQASSLTSALAPLAALCASFSQAWQQDLRTAAAELFASLRPTGRPLRFTSFLQHWRARFPGLPPTPTADALHSRLSALVRPVHQEQRCLLEVSQILPLCEKISSHMLCSPDVLLAAASEQELLAGHARIILGELHHGVQPAGWMLLFTRDAQAWQEAIVGCLPPATAHTQPATLILGRHMKTAPPEFPGPAVQAAAPSERPQQFQLSDLFVRRQDGQLTLGLLQEPEVGLLFYPPCYGVPEALYAPFAVFSYPLIRTIPLRLGEHTPRIEIGQVVYQRERWELASAALPDCAGQPASFDLLLAFARFRQRFHLPERVFVQTPGEPKAVYIDFQNVFALELLTHLAQQSEVITFVEMDPAPPDLWLRDEQGAYCSELRLLLSRAAAPSPGQKGGPV